MNFTNVFPLKSPEMFMLDTPKAITIVTFSQDVRMSRKGKEDGVEVQESQDCPNCFQSACGITGPINLLTGLQAPQWTVKPEIG